MHGPLARGRKTFDQRLNECERPVEAINELRLTTLEKKYRGGHSFVQTGFDATFVFTCFCGSLSPSRFLPENDY
jgi:hypothetical protein